MAEPAKRNYGTVYDALKAISDEENVDFGIDSYTKEQFRDKYFTGPGNIENLYNNLSQVSDETQLDFGLGTRDEWLESFGFRKSGNGYQYLDGSPVGRAKPKQQTAAATQPTAQPKPQPKYTIPDEPQIYRPEEPQKPAWQQMLMGQEPQQEETWAQKGVREMHENIAEEEARRAQPLVDTGIESMNNGVIKTVGQWEDELQAGVNELSSKWVRPQVDAAMQEAKDAWSKTMDAYRYAPAQAQLTMANENLNPDRIITRISAALEDAYNTPEMQRDIAEKANAAGIPVEDYISQVVKPTLQGEMQHYFYQRELQEYLPKNTIEYIAQGLNNSIVGMLNTAVTDSKAMRQLRNEAAAMTEEGDNADYTPGIGAKLGQLAVSFTADSPFFGIYGKVSGTMVKKVAEREIKKMMAKGLTEGAARNIVGTALENSLGKRMKNYLMSHIISSGTTLAGYNMTSEAARQVNAGEFKPGQILKSGAEGFATGAAFGATGAVTEALTQPLAGIQKIGAKALGFGAEAETMYATEELAKLAQGEDAFTNPFEGTVESMMKLGVMKVSSPEGLTKTTEAILHPIRSSKRQHTGVNFTKEEQELLRQSVEGSNFIRALSDMQAEVSRFDINQRTESNPELKAARERLARNYNEVMSNTEIPATLKEKIAAVSGGIYRRGLETGADIVHNADGSVVVMTRDKDGNCIQRLPFDSFSEAEEWRDQYTDHFRLNDVANTWNDMSVESRTAALKRVADEHGTDAEGAANMITAALRGMMGTDFTDGELLSVVDAVTETAYPSDEPHTAHNYAEGRKMAPEERRAAVRDVERAESKLTYWGQEYADEVMGAVDNPDAKVAELAARDDTTGDQVQAAVDYYNKRAKADGALDEALAKVDEQVTEANADVVRNTHQESGKVVEVDLWGNKYYITAGKIQIDANGQIDPYNSDKTIVARNVDTGEMRMLSPDRPITVTSLSNPKDIVAANESMEGMRGQLLEEVSNSVTYAEGTPMEPVSGDIYTGRDGKRYVVLDTFDQESGTVSHNKVEVKPDGSFDFEKTLPFDLEEYRQAKSDEIEAAAEAEAGIAPVVEEAPSVVGGEEQAIVEEAPSVVERETPAAPVAEEKPAAPTIPTDEQGRPQYERASVEDTKADLIGKYGAEITGQMVEQMAASSAKAVEDLEKKDLSGITDMAELAQHYDELLEARKKKQYWDQVRESLKAPEKPAEPVAEEKPATPVEEEKPVEPTPEEKPAAVDEKPAAPVADTKPAAPADETPATPVEDSKKKAAEERKKKLERAYKTSRHRKLLTSVLDDAEQEELLAAHEKVERLRAEMAADAKSFTSYLNKKYAGEDMSNVDVRNRYNAEMDEHSRRWEEANGLLKAIDAESELVSRLSDKHMEDLFGAEATERTRIIGDSHGAERYKKTKEAYKGTEAEALFDDDAPIDVYEFVSQNMPKNISWEDIEVGGRVKRGLASELGWKGTKRGIGHGKSTNAFNAYLAKKGEGISLQDAVHQLFTAADGKYSDADIRNAVLDMFLNASKPSDISDYWINERISAAESIISSAKEQELADYENYLATTGLRFSNKRRLNTPDAINRVYLARRREIDRDLMDARWRLVRERARLQAMKDAAPEEGTMFPEVEADLSDANKERILKPLQDDIAYYERLAATNERERLKALRDARDAEKRQTEISFADRLEQQKAATDTNPSIAQKESGNYRKGRLSFGGYEFVIENPKGSERSGVDAEGNEWSQEMNNTYGYIRGRKGRDGDAIDMFINDNADLDNWNGTVYVVDQVKPDGTFDEHKVMYGFGSEEEARQAYLSNYEDGWKGLGNITGVDKATFDKWLESSRKKVKPFAEHATVLHALGKHPWGADEEARRAPLRKRLDRWTDNGAIKVNIVESVDEVSNAEALARIEAGEDVRGWFDTKTKEAYIYMPNIKDARQLDRAFLHEVVSHKGLRSLLGDQAYNQLCDAVYDSMSYEDRQEYLNYANVKKMGGLAAQRAAADEYMAHLSEDSSLSKSTWQKIVKWVKDKFREKFGGEELLVTDGDIEKLLRASYKNMRRENRERAIKEISKETEGQMDGQATRMSTSSIIEGGGFKAGITDDDGNISPMTDKEGNMVIEMGGKTFSAKMPVTLRDIKSDKNSTLNIMLKFAVEDAKTITKERADVIRQKYADIINMYLNAGAAENGGPEAGTNGKWLWLGETVFRTIATNGDKQYSYSADITRVCKKNEAVIRAISALQQAQGYGATPSQIMDIYEATRVEGYQVPCPVCYVFSRYLRNGKYASAAINGMRKYGEHLPGGSDPWTLEQWITEFEARGGEKSDKKLQASIGQANEDISRLLKAIDRRGMKVLDPKTSEEEKEKLRKEIEQLDEQYRAALDVSNQQSLTNWIKTFAIQSVDGEWQMRPDARKPEDMKDFEDNALDIRRVAETMRKYPAIQRLRKSGCAAAGKEITFESNNELGEVISGVGTSNPSESINWFKAAAEAKTDAERAQYMEKAKARFMASVRYAQQQSLRGGQRMWSWSDNIEALSPDVAVNLMQMEMLGGALQAYSKQLEGVALAASMGGYVNGSLMAKDSGWREVTEDMIERRGDKIVLREDIGETIMEPTLQGWRRRERVLAKAGSPIYEENGKRYVLIFDDIIGIDPYGRVDDKGNRLMGLFDLNNQYDRAGNIIVGMNDRHVRASMADDRIYFIIPWHSSGQSVHILKSMLGFLGTDLRNFNPVDYTKMQEEKNYGVKNSEGEYPKVPQRLVDIWEKYRNEDDWTSGIGAIASGDGKGGLSRQQWEYRRLRDAIFDGTIESDPKSLKKVKKDTFLSQVYEKVKTHGGSMTSADKEFIYPYEYWDEKSTYDNADVNGARYLEYCRRLGFRPKFTGKWGDGNKWTNEGNFAEDRGYWKLLIDRRMYDRNGRFQDLTPTNSEGFTPDLVDPVVTGSRYVRTQVADPEGTRRIVGRVLKLQDERAELTGNGVPQANYDMSMREAVDRYNKVRSKIKITDADYQHKTYDDPEGGHIRLSVVTDKKEVERLEKEPKVPRLRAMAKIDGKFYPPMSAFVDGALRAPTEEGVWEKSEETEFNFTKEQKAAMDALDRKAGGGTVVIIPGKLRYHKDGKTPYDPETGKGSKGKLQFRLLKDNGDDVWAAYNPYFHTSTSGLNDQFSSAWNRPNLVVVRVAIPESEAKGGYQAAYAKNGVGDADWKSGPVNGSLPKNRRRTVTLSRYSKILEEVEDREVAEMVAEQLKDLDIKIPFNVVTPSLREELVKHGVKIGPPEDNNAGHASMPAYEQWLEDGGNSSGKEGAVRFSIGKNGRQLRLFGEDEMTGGMIPREGNLFDQKNEEGRQVDMFEQAARISDEVEKDEAAATAASVVKETSSKIDDFGKKIGLARKDVAVSGINRGKRSAVPSWRKKYQVLNVTEEMLNSKDSVVGEQVEFDPSKPFIAYTIKETPWFRRMVPVKDKDGKIMMFRSQEELESVLPVFEAASQGFKVKENEGRFEIVKRASTGKDVMYGVFDTKEDAEAYLNSPEGATTLLNHKARNYEFPPLENLTRIGMKDWRQGRDITGQDMLEEFGFRGGEFGNWVSDAERQQFLNTAYDSLKDLAELLGISPRALSLGGALSIAFGARGHSKYAAHYEPGRAVINMTKMKGAGSLAHEWAHALDNYFGMMMAGLEREHGGKNERYATEEYYSPRVRREVMEAFRDVVNTMKRKIVTRAKDTSEAQAQVDDLRKKLDYALKKERESLMRGVRKYEYNRSTKQRESKEYKPTEEDMKEFDRLIAELEKDPQWNWDPAKGGWRLTSDAGKALYDLIKVYEPNTKGTYGPAHNVAYYLDKLKKATDRLNEAKAGESETVAVDTDFTKGSRRADAGRAGSYYAKTIEMFARAFETYLADKMAKAGKSSDYLTYRKGDIFKTLFGFSVYPEGEELKAVSNAMDKLFETIDEKVDDDGNTILFSVKNDDERRRTPIFQSNAARAVEGIRQEKATPEQWQKMIEKAGGMKAAEDKWTGLSDWLKGQDKKSLTKEEVMDYIRQNQVQVEEVSYVEGLNAEAESRLDNFNREFEELIWEGDEKTGSIYTADWVDYAYEQMVERYGDDFRSAFGIEGTGSNSRLVPSLDWNDDMSGAAKYFLGMEGENGRPIHSTRLEYTTNGLENKREIALTVPTIESWNESDEVHFGDAGEGRAVAWVRFGDTEIPRKDPEARKRFDDAQKAWDDFGGRMYDKYGASYSLYLNEAEKAENSRLQKEYEEAMANYKEANSPQRVLVIDEIQSKRHQEGRERGYRTADSPVERRHRATEAMNDYRQKMQEKYGDYFVSDDMSPEEKAEYDRLYQEMKDAMAADNDKNKSYDIPEAPFEKNWHELAMKRMLRYAAENGYDKIAWTKGDQQAERYDIGGKVDWIQRGNDYGNDADQIFISIGGKTNDVEVDENRVIVDANSRLRESIGKPLSDLLGKELADKVMNSAPGTEGRLSGEGLRVGGEGMKGFYDKMLPNFMNKYGKKWGVKVEEVELPKVEKAARKMWAVDVTPEMKESVTQEPQLMFSIGSDRERTDGGRKDTRDDIRFMLRGEVGTVKDIAAQRQLNTAREMEKGGKDSKAIWLATGWERGADGQWRNEIPDARPKRIDPKKVKTLGDLIDAPEMFESYPELRDYKVTMKRMKAAGSFNAEEKEIKLDTEYNTVPDISPEDEERIHAMTMDFIRNGNWKTSRDVTNYKKKLLAGYGVKLDGVGLSTILHEMQHAIQRIEGFSRGGNADIMAKEFLVERAKVDPELATFAEEFAQYSTANDMMRYGRENFAKLLRRENANVTEENKSKIADLAEALEVMSDSDFSDFVDMAKRLASRAKKEGLARYHRIAGEVEARNVEARNKMTEEERLQTPPSETEDTGRDEQILRFSTGEQGSEKVREKYRDIKPVGKGDFGDVYDQFRGKPKEAIEFLMMKGSGEATGALSHKDVGDIDLVWGEEGTGKSDGYGLAKLVKYHPEVLENLQEILDSMRVKSRTPNRINLESDTHQAAVRLTWNEQKKKWLLTAFEKKNSALANTTDTVETSDRGMRNDTATPQSTVSEDKDTNNSLNFQENSQKNEDTADNGMRFMTGGGGRSGEDAQALYETALANWKRRNGLPDDAVEPTPEERPVHHPGEDVIEYARALSNYNRNVAMWQTAPRLEDYENRRQEKQVIEDAIAEARRYPESQGARMNVMEAELVRLRHAVSRQRTYDRATVKAVTDFAQEFMRQGFGDNMTRGEMERVLSAVKNATGARDIKKHVDKVLDILVDSHLRNLDNSIWKMSSIRELKQNAVGVEVQGRLELKGQRMIQAFREAIGTKMSADDLRARLGEIGDKMSSDREDADMWEQEYEGVSIALQYVDNINGSRQEWENLRQQYKDAIRDYRASGRSYEAQQQLLESINESMRENKIERIGLYQDIIQRLGGNIEESREGAKAFVEREKERVARIHTLANSDLAGKPMGAMRQSTKMSRLANSTGARFFLSPLATFEQMLRQFGSRNARGEGNLYNHFMRTWIDSIDREFTNTTAAKEELDAKAREVFGGKVKRWSDLYELVRRLPMAEVSVVDQGEPKTYTLTQGNLLYIYMADKMTDGKMKLREMGITEENVEEIKAMLDPRLIALGDWLQEDYLVRKRVEYNKVHERMFGAPMAAIENYFPIKVLKDARYIEEDVGLPETDLLPTTVTGSIIKRRRNSLPLDILSTDALSLAIEHVEDMEHWAATAEWNKDVNTLLSYTTFRNKVKNMNTIYGSGDQLWNTFKAAAQMAAGEYRPRVKPGSVDKTISNIAKGVTAAKISFRVYTAFKQTLSAPAFLHDVNLGDFVKYGANPYGSWKWAMENMPVFKKRWMSRQAGDTRLMDDPTDWKLWKDNIVQLASRMGMSPNALVDGVTCAVGARAIYESRLKKYMKMGVSEETAKRRALQDAEIGYNLTQQSSEGAFVSAIQKDRTLAANALSVFRNSSMAYTRQWVDAARNLKHRFEPGYKEDSIKFMAQQLQNDLGLDAGQARKAAEQEYARAGRHEVAKLLNFMFGVTFAWNLGASLPYLLIGDDDETKKQMLEDAAFKALFAGPTEGLASGNIYSDLVGLATNEQVRKAYSTEGAWGGVMQGLDNMGDYDINPLPLMADISRLISKMKYDGYAAAQEVFNICMQSGVGVNPQTFTDMWNACMDYAAPAWDGTSYTFDARNMAHAKEIALFFMRLANAPTSSWRNKYIDELGMTGAEADKLPYDELAKRYAHYKHWKDVPVTGFFRSKEERDEKTGKIRKQFDKAVEERMARLEGDELQDNLERSMDADERRMIAKLIHQRIMGSGEDSKKPKTDWQRQYQKWMTYEDIRDAEMLSRIKTEAKSAGDKTTVDYITKTNSKITEIKKNLIKGEQSGEEMMEQIRQIRRKALQQVRKDYNINEE